MNFHHCIKAWPLFALCWAWKTFQKGWYPCCPLIPSPCPSTCKEVVDYMLYEGDKKQPRPCGGSNLLLLAIWKCIDALISVWKCLYHWSIIACLLACVCACLCVCRNVLSSQEVVDFISERIKPDESGHVRSLSSIIEEVFETHHILIVIFIV